MTSLPIAEVAGDRAELLQRHFAPSEVDALEPRHPRTTAGFLAAKTALRELCAELLPQLPLRERSFQLGHDDRGAPRVEAIHADLSQTRWSESEVLKMINLSITHTRDWAYGYALLDEAACPPRP